MDVRWKRKVALTLGFCQTEVASSNDALRVRYTRSPIQAAGNEAYKFVLLRVSRNVRSDTNVGRCQ